MPSLTRRNANRDVPSGNDIAGNNLWWLFANFIIYIRCFGVGVCNHPTAGPRLYRTAHRGCRYCRVKRYRSFTSRQPNFPNIKRGMEKAGQILPNKTTNIFLFVGPVWRETKHRTSTTDRYKGTKFSAQT